MLAAIYQRYVIATGWKKSRQVGRCHTAITRFPASAALSARLFPPLPLPRRYFARRHDFCFLSHALQTRCSCLRSRCRQPAVFTLRMRSVDIAAIFADYRLLFLPPPFSAAVFLFYHYAATSAARRRVVRFAALHTPCFFACLFAAFDIYYRDADARRPRYLMPYAPRCQRLTSPLPCLVRPLPPRLRAATPRSPVAHQLSLRQR